MVTCRLSRVYPTGSSDLKEDRWRSLGGLTTDNPVPMLRLLRTRNFSLLWWGGLVSNMGDWMLLVGLSYEVYRRTASTL